MLGWKFLWAGLAPPKVECFTWQLLRKRLAVKEELRKGNIDVWNMAFFAIVWSESTHMNDVVFNQNSLDTVEPINIIKMRFSRWVKVKCAGVDILWTDLYRFPNDVLIEKEVIDNREQISWLAPQMGTMKFNVDGSSTGKGGLVGIGGLVRDESRKIWVEFSKNAGICDSNEAELLTLKEALLIFCALSWVDLVGLISLLKAIRGML